MQTSPGSNGRVQEPTLIADKNEKITGENTIAWSLGNKVDKIHWTPELRAEAWEWLTRSPNFISSAEDVYVRYRPSNAGSHIGIGI